MSRKDDVDRHGRTELHHAALKGDTILAGELIEAGFDVNAADGKGLTPLHLAAQGGSGSMVRLLLKHGADPNRRDMFSSAPLWTAMTNWDGSDEIVNLLVEAGANPHLKNDAGRAPEEVLGSPERKPGRPVVRVRHAQFGEGTLVAVRQETPPRKIEVDFDTVGRKILLERFVTPIG